ncbi:unnamed protein product [Schistosoma curassoni]|uniref:Transposase n=1 Tax=Schistosoma curassoni TaxID=6186 RepID=A0A183JLC3_9TREM|nr:unnamed protein product [Schistosoma curassoni]
MFEAFSLNRTIITSSSSVKLNQCAYGSCLQRLDRKLSCYLCSTCSRRTMVTKGYDSHSYSLVT